jgi:hypothetical protein
MVLPQAETRQMRTSRTIVCFKMTEKQKPNVSGNSKTEWISRRQLDIAKGVRQNVRADGLPGAPRALFLVF